MAMLLICLYSYIIQIYIERQDEGILLLSIKASSSNPLPFNQMTLARQYFIREVELIREICYCFGMSAY